MADLFGTESGIVFQNERLSFVGQNFHKIPPVLAKVYGSQVTSLDLSYGALTSLQGIEEFSHLKELILDGNSLSDGVTIPNLPFLHTLSVNKNNIRNLELLVRKVKENLPSLTYLSLLGNKACPNQLSDTEKDDEDYKRYRYYVINQLPELRFLDSTPVTSHEKVEAERRGHLMRVAKPLNTNQSEDGHRSSPTSKFTPLPKSKREIGDHQGAFGKCRYRYSGKHSEGNRFIQNNDL